MIIKIIIPFQAITLAATVTPRKYLQYIPSFNLYSNYNLIVIRIEVVVKRIAAFSAFNFMK